MKIVSNVKYIYVTPTYNFKMNKILTIFLIIYHSNYIFRTILFQFTYFQTGSNSQSMNIQNIPAILPYEAKLALLKEIRLHRDTRNLLKTSREVRDLSVTKIQPTLTLLHSAGAAF